MNVSLVAATEPYSRHPNAEATKSRDISDVGQSAAIGGVVLQGPRKRTTCVPSLKCVKKAPGLLLQI